MSMSNAGTRGTSLLGAAAPNKDSLDSTQIVVDSPSPSEGPLSKNARKKSKVSVWDLLRDKPNRSSLFVLYVLLITYMFSQVDRYLQPISAKYMQKDQRWGDRKGGGMLSIVHCALYLHTCSQRAFTLVVASGYQEDILVGAVFTAVYLPTGIPMGLLADRFSEYKKYMLCCAFGLWSLATLATGFTTAYWQVVLFRFLLAIGESGCTPLAGSLIADHFSRSARTTALGIYNWGIYTGFSLAYGIAGYVTDVTSWRTVWWSCGFGGCVWCFFVLLIPKPHLRRRSSSIQAANKNKDKDKEKENAVSICQIIAYFIRTPSLVILLIASLVRNAGGYVWGYGAAEFFSNVDNQDSKHQALYMQWIPLIGGCFGSLLGGYISDQYVKKSEPWKRLLILVTSNLTAAPFAFLALWLPAPYCYLMLIGSNVIGEMWVGICIALVIELVPQNMKTTALSIYFFWIGIAGFFPLLVTPLQHLFCGSQVPSCDEGLRWAIIVLFPGLYVLSSGIFFTSMVFLKRDRQKAKLQHAIRLHGGH